MSNIGAVATINCYQEFEAGAKEAYRQFKRRQDLTGLTPQECHVKEDEFNAGYYPPLVKVSFNGHDLVLPVKPHKLLPPLHVRVCTPEPESEAA